MPVSGAGLIDGNGCRNLIMQAKKKNIIVSLQSLRCPLSAYPPQKTVDNPQYNAIIIKNKFKNVNVSVFCPAKFKSKLP